MLLRALAIVAVAAACAGCANGVVPPSLAQETATLGVAPTTAQMDAAALDEKSLAAKVLAALALERSTGRTPDPGRLDDLN